MGEVSLTPELIYDSLSLKKFQIPLSDIKHLSFSIQPISNFSILPQLSSLSVIILRLCSISKFPTEFLLMPNIKSIDLSGNSISVLPSSDELLNMKSLMFLNLSDNSIEDISEIMKLSHLPKLISINFVGNACTSFDNCINRVISDFNNIYIVNDNIIPGQYKAFLLDMIPNAQNSMIPLSKIDDYFIKYAKYMKDNENEIHIRKFNAEIFSLHKVLRKYCCVTKIQSIWRGVSQKKKYLNLRKSVIIIQRRFTKWYYRRINAASRIIMCYRRYKLGYRCKLVHSSKKIQSVFRKMMVIFNSVLEILCDKGEFMFYTTKENVHHIISICENNDLEIPSVNEDEKFLIIRKRKPKYTKLPGSPLIYYLTSGGLILRKINNNKIDKNFSLWCKHDHSTPPSIRRTEYGVNIDKKCLFDTLRPTLCKSEIKKHDFARHYETLYLVKFSQIKQAKDFFRYVRIHPKPDLQLIPYQKSYEMAAVITIQSACRMFLVRKRNYQIVKRQILERRALSKIGRNLKIALQKRKLRFIATFLNYLSGIKYTHYFYISERIPPAKVKHPVEFGYDSERCLTLTQMKDTIIHNMLPVGNMLFSSNSIESLMKFNVTSMSALPTMFSQEKIRINSKWLKKYKIVRIGFNTLNEARNRIILFTWLTGNLNYILFEDDVIRLCAADYIKNAWIGYHTRLSLVYYAHNFGKNFNPFILLKKHTFSISRNESDIDNTYKKVYHDYVDPSRRISMLRDGCLSWKEQMNEFKQKFLEMGKSIKQNPKFEDYPEERPMTPGLLRSRRIVGLETDMEEDKTEEIQTNESIPATHTLPTLSHNIKSTRDSKLQTQAPIYKLDLSNDNFMKATGRTNDALNQIYSGKINYSQRSKTALNTHRAVSSNKVKVLVDLETESESAFKIPLTDRTPTTEERDNNLNTPQMKRPSTAINKMPLIKQKNIPIVPIKAGKTPRRQKPDLTPLDQDAEPESSQYKTITSFNPSFYPETNIISESAETTRPYASSFFITEFSHECFVRLAHLHQIGSLLDRSEVSDGTIETKRQTAKEAKEQMLKIKADNQLAKDKLNIENRERFRIEQIELANIANRKREKMLTQRTNSAKRIREDHKNRQQKFKDDKIFAINFISATRKLAYKTELVHRKREQDRILEETRCDLATIRVKDREQREKMKKAVTRIREDKLEFVRRDKQLLDERKEAASISTARKMENIARIKQELKETIANARATRARGFTAIFPNYQPFPETDDIEGSAAVLHHYVGDNIGYIESHWIANMLYSYTH